MRSTVAPLFFAAIILFATTVHAEIWIPLDFPGASSTSVCDVDGSKVLGVYSAGSGGYRSFLCEGTNWTTLQYPGAYSTDAASLENGIIVGTYAGNYYNTLNGFTYDGTTWTPLNYPGAQFTIVSAMNSGTIVGRYTTVPSLAFGSSGFVYDGQSWTTVRAPGAFDTFVTGIDNATLVGFWNQDLNPDPWGYSISKNKGFIFDGTNWTSLNYPGATETRLTGISGDVIVGSYSSTSSALEAHGLIYDGETWLTLDFPGAAYTEIFGIDGDTIWGSYRYSLYGADHGFIYIIPEPGSLVLLGLGGLLISRRK